MYTKEQVIQIIDRILEHPDKVIDAVTVENSEYSAAELFKLVEIQEKINLISSVESIAGQTYISFDSNSEIKQDDYFKLLFNGRVYYFVVSGVNYDTQSVSVRAKEVGYWAHATNKTGVTLTQLINQEVELIKNVMEINEIRQKSLWC